MCGAALRTDKGMYRAHGQKIFPGHGEHGDITVGFTDYPYGCFIIAAGIFFSPPCHRNRGAEREDCLLDFCLRGLAEQAI